MNTITQSQHVTPAYPQPVLTSNQSNAMYPGPICPVPTPIRRQPPPRNDIVQEQTKADTPTSTQPEQIPPLSNANTDKVALNLDTTSTNSVMCEPPRNRPDENRGTRNVPDPRSEPTNAKTVKDNREDPRKKPDSIYNSFMKAAKKVIPTNKGKRPTTPMSNNTTQQKSGGPAPPHAQIGPKPIELNNIYSVLAEDPPPQQRNDTAQASHPSKALDTPAQVQGGAPNDYPPLPQRINKTKPGTSTPMCERKGIDQSWADDDETIEAFLADIDKPPGVENTVPIVDPRGRQRNGNGPQPTPAGDNTNRSRAPANTTSTPPPPPPP